MKIIFMGTPQIAVPCIEALYNNGYDIPLVVTQPDKPKGRGNKMQACPVKEFAVSKGIEVYQPEKLKNNQEAYEKLKSVDADFYAVAAYGKILPEEILALPKFAPVNVHFSLLPKYRGAAPVNWAIINGDKVTGVSTMFMDKGMDTGDILLMAETEINNKNAETLSNELSKLGADLLIETLNNFSNITPKKQDNNNATIAPMMKKDDGLIDWNKEAVLIEREIRGFYPWPAVYTHIDGKLIKFFDADVDNNDISSEIGSIYNIDKSSFSVATSKGGLIVKEVQLEGKKRMDAKSFMAGFSLSVGKKFE